MSRVLRSRRDLGRRRRRWGGGFVIACAGCAGLAWFGIRWLSYPVPALHPPPSAITLGGSQWSHDSAELRLGPATLRTRGRIGVLRLSGPAADSGTAQGALLAPRIPAAVAAFDAPLRGRFPGRLRWLDSLRLSWRLRDLPQAFSEDLKIEASHLAAAPGVTPAVPYAAVLRAQATLDFGAPLPWSTAAPRGRLTRSLTVIAPLLGPRGDRLVMGRSFALPGFDEDGQALTGGPVLQIRQAAGRLSHASVGWPGLLGVVTGVNERGIAVGVHYVLTDPRDVPQAGTPLSIVARAILERAEDLASAIELARSTRTLGSGILVIVDGRSRTWARIDRTSEVASVLENPKGRAVVDLLEGEAYAQDAENDRARRTLALNARRVNAQAQLQAIKGAETEELVAVLRSRATPEGGTLPPGHRAAIADAGAIHTAIIDPSTLRVWIADGSPASRFLAFDLRQELSTSGTPAFDLDIPADESQQLEAGRRVLAARSELARARRARLAGELAQARIHALRALAWSPRLPQALLLAGDLARQDGDEAAAQIFFRDFLRVGADDPDAETYIRERLNTSD